MRVLHTTPFLDPITGGGNVERTIQLCRALADQHIDCQILTVTLGFSDNFLLRLKGLKIIAYPCLWKRFYIPFTSFSSIRKVVREADVIHLMGHWSVLNALIFLATQFENKPYVVCPAGALHIYGRSRVIKRFYNWVIGRRIIQNAHAWIAITPEECAQFKSYGVTAEQVTIIPNGINPADFLHVNADQFDEQYALHPAPFILFLGRLNPIKGPDLLLEAFYQGRAKWPQWHLVFAGPDGGLLSELKSRVEAYHLTDHVHFIGYLEGSEKAAAYKCAELLAIPSRHEAMSIVALEAGICGTPVLLTDQCGFDGVQNAGGGIVTPASVAGIEIGLDQLLSADVNLEIMGQKLQGYVQKQYTWSEVIKQYLELYNKLLPNM